MQQENNKTPHRGSNRVSKRTNCVRAEVREENECPVLRGRLAVLRYLEASIKRKDHAVGFDGGCSDRLNNLRILKVRREVAKLEAVRQSRQRRQLGMEASGAFGTHSKPVRMILLEPVSGQNEFADEAVLVARIIGHVFDDVVTIDEALSGRHKCVRQIFSAHSRAIDTWQKQSHTAHGSLHSVVANERGRWI